MCDDFDNDTVKIDISRLSIKKSSKPKDDQMCCNVMMNVTAEGLSCDMCGYLVFTRTNESIEGGSYSTSYNTGPSDDKTAVRVSQGTSYKKTFTVYPCYKVAKDYKVSQEFKNIREQNPWMDNGMVNEGKRLYTLMVIDNNITKKNKRKKAIELAFIYIAYENFGKPMSKIEFARLVGETETSITKGYNFIYAGNDFYKLDAISYCSLDLIDGFVNRFKPMGLSQNIEKFIINMTNIVKDNEVIHMNKHSSCLAAGIILYTSNIFNLDIDLNNLSSLSHMSIKSIKGFCSILTKIKNDKDHRANEHFILIIKNFVPKEKDVQSC